MIGRGMPSSQRRSPRPKPMVLSIEEMVPLKLESHQTGSVACGLFVAKRFLKMSSAKFPSGDLPACDGSF